MKADEVILSVDFSKNYANKQRHEIQSVYFGHECFMIFTAACYFNNIVGIPGNAKRQRKSTENSSYSYCVK